MKLNYIFLLFVAVVMSFFMTASAMDVAFCEKMCEKQKANCGRERHRGRQESSTDSSCDVAHAGCISRCTNLNRRM